MKIGFDLHGVLDTNPEKFRKLLEGLGDVHRIHVISGPPLDEIRKELTNLHYVPGKHYYRILSVVDYLKQNDVEMWQDSKGTWWADDKDWWQSKANICKEYDIDVMIDDHEKYGSYFSSMSIAKRTRFILYSPFLFPRLMELIHSIRLDKPINCDYFKD